MSMKLEDMGGGTKVMVDGHVPVSLAPAKGVPMELEMELMEALVDVRLVGVGSGTGNDQGVGTTMSAWPLVLDVAPTEGAIVEVEDVVLDDGDNEGHAYHDGDDVVANDDNSDDAIVEDVSAPAISVAGDVDVALDEDEEDHGDHNGGDEDAAAADDDGVDSTLKGVFAAATTVSRGVDAGAEETALDVQLVSFPY